MAWVHPGTAPGPRAVPARSTSKLSARRSFYSPLNDRYSELGDSGEMHPTPGNHALSPSLCILCVLWDCFEKTDDEIGSLG
jgi:hypothetical protein